MKPILNTGRDNTIRAGDRVIAIRDGLEAHRRGENNEGVNDQREEGTLFEYFQGDTGTVMKVVADGFRLKHLIIKADDGRHYKGASAYNWEKIE